ncbi:N-succinyl-L-ornithine transcarbamylase [Lewinella marina]|uniref:N-succinylornithine carbamoyltransferase n=1 Tax=Neolewinella marina TaxID=438751 RepID=A0A2G0CD50_9BACT|nr:acetylornithine carbamoyltransferase [Neolewinella marina]NJB86957.1 N-succinyl-L-ornithine transcarbamylase [Neolewinella marina]PHK97847.1 acetylornithine carbamoyltransferase [Neolewinella marina]
MENFLSVHDAASVHDLIGLAAKIKAAPLDYDKTGQHKTLINLFFNPSLRTRLSTEKAGVTLGFQVITMDMAGGWKLEFEDGVVMNLDRAEHVREAAGVLSQYCDVLAVRSFPELKDRDADYADRVINAFVKYATVPVVSLESAIRHPLQSLADCLTIREHRRSARPRVALTWAPHPRQLPQAVPNSFAEWMIHWGDVDLVIANPEGFDLAPEFTRGAEVVHDQAAALRGAEFVYAKNWSSYSDYGATADLPDWIVNEEKMALTDDAFFMHCLPVRRNVIVSDGVLNSDRSLVLQQANNRTWAAAAVLAALTD